MHVSIGPHLLVKNTTTPCSWTDEELPFLEEEIEKK